MCDLLVDGYQALRGYKILESTTKRFYQVLELNLIKYFSIINILYREISLYV